MKVNYTGCAICDSAWGNLWEVVEGTRLFFCCAVCVAQFRNLVDRIKAEARWDAIDSLIIEGDRRGRLCTASRGAQSYSCRVAFNTEGAIRSFRTEAIPSPA